jgi:hypothetical protein
MPEPGRARPRLDTDDAVAAADDELVAGSSGRSRFRIPLPPSSK